MSLECSSSGEPPAPDLAKIVGVLDDTGCREIVSILEEPMTVDEIADEADLPLSTTYRKLDCLTDASLVTETSGVRRGSHRKSRYIADFDRIAISLDETQEFRVDVDRAANRSLDLWAAIEREC
ncbi:winged helix-turn-helix domain-containing protein [Halopiger djelfimassiliensis]|uniref:winged helix-turn-helix domain-containing protein n=1 Tax=Halopiger djelfimassiliensis TaxID=1293047 RepID=UPI0006780A5C|nr:winged helix-turn-helix domain-containing protein [Halopiger djelfimassiliensis]